jgi:hypothetical protein
VVRRAAEPPPVEQVQRRYDCESCGAPKSYPCTTTGGHVLSISHSARYHAAVRDGALPLPQPTADEVAHGRIVP